MKDTPQGFAKRLEWALCRLAINQPDEQARMVASSAGVTLRTAKKYLTGESRPNLLDHRYDGLANALGVFVGWLIYGGDDIPRTQEEISFMQRIQMMTDEERSKLRRVIFLWRNGSKRVRNLWGLTESGYISPATFLDLAGGKVQ